MTAANLARHRTNPNMPFWRMIKEGNDHFEVTHMEPKVDVCDRHYVFDAQPPANSAKPLAFNPTGHCPAFEVSPQLAALARDKEQHDEAQFTQLARFNAPVAPIKTGTDGGSNRVFIAQIENSSADGRQRRARARCSAAGRLRAGDDRRGGGQQCPAAFARQPAIRQDIRFQELGRFDPRRFG